MHSALEKHRMELVAFDVQCKMFERDDMIAEVRYQGCSYVPRDAARVAVVFANKYVQ
jgi:hypothetical protein